MGYDDKDYAEEIRKENAKILEQRCKGVGVALWVATVILVLIGAFIFGHYTLTEEQDAVVETFGKPTVVSKTGWNWNIPFVQRVTKVPRTIKGMAIGYDPETNESILRESLMITKDFSFVNVDLYVEYRVSDPIQAVIHEESYHDIIKNLAQSYERDTVGVHLVDDVITTGKTQIQMEIESKLKERIAAENIGYSIERVLIQDVELPSLTVDEAFKAVESAKQSMEVAINNAEEDKNKRIPEMEAQVDKIIKEAESYKQKKIDEANGQVARFEALYEEYAKFPRVTRKRMFYETMDDILPGLDVTIITTDGTQTMLPLKPFTTESKTVTNPVQQQEQESEDDNAVAEILEGYGE